MTGTRARALLCAAFLGATVAFDAQAVLQEVVNVHIDLMNADPMPDLIACDGKAAGADGVWMWMQDTTRSGVFGSARQLPGSAASQFLAAVTADFNRDGRLDVAAITGPGSATAHGVKLWLQLAGAPVCGQPPCAPNFSDTTQVSGLPTTGSFRSIIAADVDADGVPDLVLAGSAASNPGVQVWLGDGHGTFTRRQVLAPAAGNDAMTHILIADMNGDAIADLLAARADAASGCLLMAAGLGQGEFAPLLPLSTSPPNTGFGANHILIADMNADGVKDLLVATQDARLRMYALAAGAWTERCQGPCGGGNAGRIGSDATNYTSVAAGDFDNDGKMDVVAASDAGVAQLSLFQGAGAFAFPTPATNMASGLHRAVAFTDFNDDGTLDVVSADGSIPPGPNGASCRTVWNHKHELAAPPDLGCIPLRGNPPVPTPTFDLRSLTNLEDGLKYRIEISQDRSFGTLSTTQANLDMAQSTIGWSAPVYAPLAAAEFSDAVPALLPGQTYYWRVFTYGRGRRSPPSNTGDASTRRFSVDVAPPQAVADAAVTKADCPGGTQLHLTWTPVTTDTQGNPETISYRLYRATSPEAPFPGPAWTLVAGAIPQSGNPSYDHCEQGAAALYYYRVHAVDGCSSEGW